MKHFHLIFLFFLFHWVSAQTISYKQETLSSSLFIQDVDSLFIDSCVFSDVSGYAIRVENVSYVKITNSRFTRITAGAIKGMGCKLVRVENNYFDSIVGEGIRFPYDGSTTKAADRTNKIIIANNRMHNILGASGGGAIGIRLFHTDSAFVINNHIDTCEASGMRFGLNSNFIQQNLQKINYLLIEGNTILHTESDGISGQENVFSSQVINNEIAFIGYKGSAGGRPVNGDHGMYWQCPDAIIKGNYVHHNLDTCSSSGCAGLGISIRSSAIVSHNIIHDCANSGIAYFNDHNSGNGILEISNNIIYNTNYRSIYLNGGSSGTRPSRINIYHNTLHAEPSQPIWHHSNPLGINEMNGSTHIIGNILFYQGETDLDRCFWQNAANIQTNKFNLSVLTDPGFVNKSAGQYFLKAQSPAIDSIPYSQAILTEDAYFNVRDSFPDIGACEWLGITNGVVQIWGCDSAQLPNTSTYIYTNTTQTDTIYHPTQSDTALTYQFLINASVEYILDTSCCHSFTDALGNRYYSSGNVSDTLNTQHGCDSIITTRFTVFSSDSIWSDSVNCHPIYSPSGNNLYMVSGVYPDTLSNINNCDSIVYTNFTLSELELIISNLNTDTLHITTPFDSVFWYSCSDSSLVHSSTDSLFAPASNGTYFCRASYRGCSSTSECYTIIHSSIVDQPKPTFELNEITNSTFLLTSNQTKEVIHCMIIDAQGKLVFQQSHFTLPHVITVTSGGVYIISITTKDHSQSTWKWSFE